MRSLRGLRVLFICSATLLSACISFQAVDESGQLGRIEIHRITLDSGGSRLEATVSPDGCWTFPGLADGLQLTPIWTLGTLSLRLSRCGQANRIALHSLSLSAANLRFPEISLREGAGRRKLEFPIELDDSVQFLCDMDRRIEFGSEVTINIQVTLDQDSYALVAQGTAERFKSLRRGRRQR